MNRLHSSHPKSLPLRASVVIAQWTISILFVPLLFSLMLGSGLAQSSDNLSEVMNTANQHYEAGQFIEATKNYEVLIEQGVQHGTVYYNLGNAYFKQGDLGRAIVNYRRAQRLEPRDGDIAINLAIARAQTIDQIDASGQDFGRIIGRWFTLGEVVVLLLLVWICLAITVSLYIILPRWRRFSGWAIMGWAACLLIGGLVIGSSIYNDQQSPSAVVIVPAVEVLSEPTSASEASVAFTLHAGAEIHITDRQLGWRKITLPGDLQGWVPTDAIEVVVDEG